MFLSTPSRNVSQSGECLSAWLCTYSSTTDSLGRLQGAETEREPREKVQKGEIEEAKSLILVWRIINLLAACPPSPPLTDCLQPCSSSSNGAGRTSGCARRSIGISVVTWSDRFGGRKASNRSPIHSLHLAVLSRSPGEQNSIKTSVRPSPLPSLHPICIYEAASPLSPNYVSLPPAAAVPLGNTTINQRLRRCPHHDPNVSLDPKGIRTVGWL